MKIKFGEPKNPGRMQFFHSGYWNSENSSFPIKKWYGVVVRGTFIGVIITSYEKSH